jgi:hypothetical protein
LSSVYPAISFRSGLISAPLTDQLGFVDAFAAAADGSCWALSDEGLTYFNPLEGWEAVAAPWISDDSAPAFAPVHRALVYCLDDTNGRNVVRWTRDDGMSALPAVPNSDRPVGLSAAPDGTLWAIGASGALYAYIDGAWSVLPSAGGSIRQFSVGSSTFALALMSDDSSTIMQFDNGAWSAFELPSGLFRCLSACPDGSTWLLGMEGELSLWANGSEVESFTLPFPQSALVNEISGPSRHGCWFFFEGAAYCVAYGVTTQAPTPWPEMTGTQTIGYDAISNAVDATGEGGIRDQYPNIDAPIAEWFAIVQAMEQPDKVTAADWKAIQDQICQELTYVQAVDNLFLNLQTLGNTVAAIQTDTYNEVLQMIGLPPQPTQQPDTIVDIILGTIFDKLTDAAIAKVPDEYSKIVNAGIAVFKFAADQMARQNGAPNCDVAIHLACAQLSQQLADAVANYAEVAASMQTQILEDWGKLSACGEAISTGVWYWDGKLELSLLSGIGEAAKVTYYQALMPAQWQIMLIQSFDAIVGNAPQYALLVKTIANDHTLQFVSWWWVCAQQGADVTIDSTGPWPNQKILEDIYNANVSIEDFFTGQNGWNLPIATMAGYSAPNQEIAFADWVDSASPVPTP